MSLYSHLEDDLGHDKASISSFALSAPKKYKTYQIPKRTSGTRLIAHPSKKLKEYQRSIISYLANELPIHECAVAYVSKKGVRYNANLHKNSKYLLKMDFQNFFHSITPKLFIDALQEEDIAIDKENQYLIRNLLFWAPSKTSIGKVVLSIGAPSSPLVSNFVMFQFDKKIESICKERKIIYSRYADDITFSTNSKNELFSIPTVVKKYLKAFYRGSISVNEKKTVFSSKAHNRHITGVTIANNNTLSLGRDRKRMISALIHQSTVGKLPDSDYKYLAGLLSFANDIEPVFLSRMINKYSFEAISNIRKIACYSKSEK